MRGIRSPTTRTSKRGQACAAGKSQPQFNMQIGVEKEKATGAFPARRSTELGEADLTDNEIRHLSRNARV
jgi:hypothetical protein